MRQFSMGCSSSQTAPAWVLPTVCSPSGTGCSSVGPPLGHKPCQQNLLWHGVLSPWVRRSWQGPAPAQGSPRGHSFLQASTCSGVGSSMGHRRISAPLWTSMDCRGTTCFTTGLHHELQGKALCSDISGTSSSPSFFTDLGVCRVVSLT